MMMIAYYVKYDMYANVYLGFIHVYTIPIYMHTMLNCTVCIYNYMLSSYIYAK